MEGSHVTPLRSRMTRAHFFYYFFCTERTHACESPTEIGLSTRLLEVTQRNLVSRNRAQKRQLRLSGTVYSFGEFPPHSKLKTVQKLLRVQPCDGVFYANEI